MCPNHAKSLQPLNCNAYPDNRHKSPTWPSSSTPPAPPPTSSSSTSVHLRSRSTWSSRSSSSSPPATSLPPPPSAQCGAPPPPPPSTAGPPPSSSTPTHSIPTAATATSAVEPTSRSWLRLPPGPSPPFPLRSAASSHVYTLSSSHLSFSSDPLLLRWINLPAPGVWRVDPVVALVGTSLVAAGGVSGLEDEDPLAVEVSDGAEWRRASFMPDEFKCSASAYHLSGAVCGGRLHVVDRRNARTSSFDPAGDRWTEVTDQLAGTDARPFAVAVAACGSELVLAGVMGLPEAITGVRLWAGTGAEVGRMPEDMVERFARGREGKSAAGVWAVEVRAAETGGDVYVYNPSEIGEVFCFGAGGEWRSVETGVEGGSDRTKTVAVACSAVSVEELRKAFGRSTGK